MQTQLQSIDELRSEKNIWYDGVIFENKEKNQQKRGSIRAKCYKYLSLCAKTTLAEKSVLVKLTEEKSKNLSKLFRC